MQNRFLCSEVYLTHPDVSARISNIISQTKTSYFGTGWETIRKFISEGNLVFVICDLNIKNSYEERIIAVAFYSFSKDVFGELMCLEDISIDKKYKNLFLEKYFWRQIKDKVRLQGVRRFFSRQNHTEDASEKGCSHIEFVKIIDSPQKP